MKHLIGFLIAICLFGSEIIQAQQVVSSSGSHVKNDTVQLSWTIGEPIIVTITNESNILTQGMQQSRLIITVINEIEISDLEISAYPNLTIDCIYLKIIPLQTDQTTEAWRDYSFRLYDINGKLLILKLIESTETLIRIDSYSPGIYFLKVNNKNVELKTFKIIKQ